MTNNSKTEEKVVKAKTKRVRDIKAIRVFDKDSYPFIDCRTADDEVRDTVQRVFGEIIGYYEARKYANVYPVASIIGYKEQLLSEFSDYGVDVKDAKYRIFFDALSNFEQTIQVQLTSKLAQGHIEFGDIPYVFKQGMEAAAVISGQDVAGVIDSVKLHHSFFGPYYIVQFKVINNVTGTVRESTFSVTIPYFEGLEPLGRLPVRELSAELKEILAERGAKYRNYVEGVHYVQYHGQMTRSSWWSTKNFRADGRVMLDVNSFSQVDNDQFSSEGRASGLESEREDRNLKQAGLKIKDEDLWKTFPFLYGFSFAAKQWGRMTVDGLSAIKFRSDAFEKLVLPQDDKELVRAIVEDEGGDFSDLIDGKGGGSIFLLHGPPGQGKTLTAEAIAEVLERPLYSISVGELGTSPEQLESTLREILDVATIWNAVLLLDEADIFLEERDEKDIVRNAMVGVFLRLLEYHQGVLFLTTNRVKNIDQAFYSRISIGLRFGEADHAKRKSIWTNLLDAADVTGLDPDILAHHDLNGRQIKNVIKLAIKLARAKGDVVDIALVDSVIERTGNFSAS